MDKGDNLRSRYRLQQRSATPSSVQLGSQPVKRNKQPSNIIDDEKLQVLYSEKNKNNKHHKRYQAISERLKSQSRRTKIAFVVAAVLVCVVVVSVLHQLSREREPQSLGVASGELDTQDVRPVEKLSFTPFYPSDYENRGIVFAQKQRGDTDYVSYNDVLDGVPFTLTQQRSTEKLSDGDLAQLENLGKSLPVPAEHYFRVGEVPVFISEANNDRQSLVFVIEEVLFFVTAERAIREFSWVTYISNLVQ